MFRRRLEGLPKDPVFDADLTKLGFECTPSGQFVKINEPEKFFDFFFTDNAKWNEVRKEAFHACVRRELYQRLATANIRPLYLPQLSLERPVQEPHVPILVSTPGVFPKHVVVIVNEHIQDLAIWSYRILCRQGGINDGSAVGFVDHLRSVFKGEEVLVDSPTSTGTSKTPNAQSDPGVIILNPGQLLYSHRFNRALTYASWQAFPRESAVHETPRIHPEHNTVPGNRKSEEHIKFVFDKVLNNAKYVDPEAQLYILGIADGGDSVVELLNAEWPKYCSRIAAIALTQPTSTSSTITDPAFASFLAQNAKSWMVSPEPFNTLLQKPEPMPTPLSRSFSDALNALPDTMTVTVQKSVVPTAPGYVGAEGLVKTESQEIAVVPRGEGVGEIEEMANGMEEWKQDVVCETFASGVSDCHENIVPSIYKHVLEWFHETQVGKDK
ncbi:hypothetical protein LTR60_000706 [Cryomyces antarcticus]|nr:hypothetical protein LTR60_000706 [Cryomyces antarcticus]